MSTEPIRIAILGQGRSGFDIHAKWLRQDPVYKIVAVADLLPERRQQAEQELQVKTYQDYQSLLADSAHGAEVVVNALPSFLHPQGTIDSLNAGCHVVSEKPAARTVKDFDRVAAVASKNRLLWQPFQNSRFNPCFQQAMQVLDSGVLGEVVHIRMNWSGYARRWDWQCLQEFWGGNLLNTGPHPVDQAVVFLKGKKPKVTSHLRSLNPFGDAENFVSVYLQAPKSPLIEIVLSSFQAYPQGEILNISAANGGLTADNATVRWKYFDPKKAPKQKNAGTWPDQRAFCSETLAWQEESWKNPDESLPFFEQMSRAFYWHFYKVMRQKQARIITLPQVRRQIEIIEECHRQNRMLKWKKKFLNSCRNKSRQGS